MGLACLPTLRALSLSRRHLSSGGMVSRGPTAEGLLAQLAGAQHQLTSLELRAYRWGVTAQLVGGGRGDSGHTGGWGDGSGHTGGWGGWRLGG